MEMLKKRSDYHQNMNDSRSDKMRQHLIRHYCGWTALSDYNWASLVFLMPAEMVNNLSDQLTGRLDKTRLQIFIRLMGLVD